MLACLPELGPLAALDASTGGAAGWRYWEPAVSSGACVVSIFDPDPSAVATARGEALPGIDLLPFAVGDGLPLSLHLTRDPRFVCALAPEPAFAAVFESLAEALAVQAVHTFPTRPLAEAARIAGAGCDLLRVHLPGAEARVLSGAGSLLDSCVVVQTRVPLVPMLRDEPPFERIDALLAGHGFIMHRFVPGVSARIAAPGRAAIGEAMPGPGQPLWREAIYVANYADPGCRPAAAWRSLAVAADALYAAPDLAHRALWNADALEATTLAPRYLAARSRNTATAAGSPSRSWLSRLLRR